MATNLIPGDHVRHLPGFNDAKTYIILDRAAGFGNGAWWIQDAETFIPLDAPIRERNVEIVDSITEKAIPLVHLVTSSKKPVLVKVSDGHLHRGILHGDFFAAGGRVYAAGSGDLVHDYLTKAKGTKAAKWLDENMVDARRLSKKTITPEQLDIMERSAVVVK